MRNLCYKPASSLDFGLDFYNHKRVITIVYPCNRVTTIAVSFAGERKDVLLSCFFAEACVNRPLDGLLSCLTDYCPKNKNCEIEKLELKTLPSVFIDARSPRF